MQEERAGEVDAQSAELGAIRAGLPAVPGYAPRRVADGFSPNFSR
jgi:hypothetical protein